MLPIPDDGSTMVQLRPACVADIPNMEQIERACFATDRLAGKHFRHLLTRGHAITLIALLATRIQGYGLLLLRRNSRSARLYSLAIHPAERRAGLGRIVLSGLEEIAISHQLTSIHLEVRVDNAPAIAFYHGLGYRSCAILAGYYADHQDAYRMKKRLDDKH
ncbi:MAG: GNAT family N-acetyltransferase [Magnetococcales bacterium]|nr:GNAT family N-acetyltransferase [Magnetococcales bacterium]MBF0321726.1 GNAT family N-acetyltransferase [Magnetococcales bacterium]